MRVKVNNFQVFCFFSLKIYSTQVDTYFCMVTLCFNNDKVELFTIQVHRRAYGQPATRPSAVDFKLADYTAETFNDLVLKEWGYETQFFISS